MQLSAELIKDVPYGLYTQEDISLSADDLHGLITEAVPKRAYKEFEDFRKTFEWTHINMKFRLQSLEIEFVFDVSKRDIATVYFSDAKTGRPFRCSSSPVLFTGEGDIVNDVRTLYENQPFSL